MLPITQRNPIPKTIMTIYDIKYRNTGAPVIEGEILNGRKSSEKENNRRSDGRR